MNRVKIEATIDATKPEQVKAAVIFLQALSGEPESTLKDIPETNGPEPREPKEAKTPAKKKPAPKAKSTAKKITIGAVRALLAKKVGDNRAAIKEKLSELDAGSVTLLANENYAEFMDFLNDLD